MAKGLLVIISSPSGGGKDSVIQSLIPRFKNSRKLVTTTSRSPREGEINGVNYHFVSKEEFENRIISKDFVEYNFYAGNYYGTEKRVLKETLDRSDVVFTLIEVNGKINLDKAKIRHLSIFLEPESLEILRNRILSRGGVSSEALEERLKIAEEEIEKSRIYDYKVINFEGKLPETVDKIEDIIQTELDRISTLDKSAQIS